MWLVTTILNTQIYNVSTIVENSVSTAYETLGGGWSPVFSVPFC